MSSEPDGDDGELIGQPLVARELRLHRERAGLSRNELATRVGYSRSYISTCEKPGASLVSEAVVARIDEELGAGGALIRVQAEAAADRNRRRVINPGDYRDSSAQTSRNRTAEPVSPAAYRRADAEPLLHQRSNSTASPSGRQLPEALDTASGPHALMFSESSNSRGGRYVDPALVDYFSRQLDGHYLADTLLGARALIGTVSAQLRLIRELIENADGSTRPRLAGIGSAYAAFVAWLHLDAGDIDAALISHEYALELAHRSRDRESVACALVDRAMAFTDAGQGAAVVDLCDAALIDDRHLSPEIQVFALQQQAHGASLLGDRRQVDALLEKAGILVDRVDVEVWGTACRRTPGYVEVQRATCYGRLGLAAESDRLWQQIIPQAPLSARRDVGVWSARQSAACLDIGEPERAVALAKTAVEISLETGSARAVRALSALPSAIGRWQAEPVGRDMAEVLAPVIDMEREGPN